jgi:hypothetical protein
MNYSCDVTCAHGSTHDVRFLLACRADCAASRSPSTPSKLGSCRCELDFLHLRLHFRVSVILFSFLFFLIRLAKGEAEGFLKKSSSCGSEAEELKLSSGKHYNSAAVVLQRGQCVFQRTPVLLNGLQHDLVVVLQRGRGVYKGTPDLLDGLQHDLVVVLQRGRGLF